MMERTVINYGTQSEDWVLPNKNKMTMEKKTEINKKKKYKKREKDFLLLWSSLLVEVLYLETK